MISNETSLNYKISDLVKHYNFDIEWVFAQGCMKKIQKIELIQEFKTYTWDPV